MKTDNQKRDHALYYLEIPDAGFSPKRNKMVIENSIKKYEAMRRKKKHEFDDAYRERADAVVSYLRAADQRSVKLGDYFSAKNIRMLRGDEMRAKIHEGITFIKANRKLKGRA